VYERAIQLDPSSSEVFRNLGNLLAKLNDQRAEEVLRKSLELSPRSLATLSDLGSLLAQKRKILEAQEILRRAVDLLIKETPKDYTKERAAAIYLNYGSLLYLLGEIERGTFYHQLAQQTDPGR